MKKIMLLMCAFFMATGCATVRTDFAPLQFSAPAVKTSGDILLTTGDSTRPYKELGVIFVKGHYAGYQCIMEKLREKAQEVGADAVIKIEFGGRFPYYHRHYCRGVAVSFK